MLRNKWRLVSIGLLGVIAIIAGAIYAAHPNGDAEVRIGAKRHDDGRVEVAMQQRDAEGGWGELQRPDARFLPADVTGEWRMSSPVAVASAMAASDAMTTMPDVAAGSDNLYCIIHHGAADDPFWLEFDLVAQTNAHELGLSNVEIHSTTDIAEHAAMITDCVDRGAWGVASSIPELDGLRDALIAVRSSGAVLLTFNSGDEVAGLVGSTNHYALDERAAGELAAREFTAAGATGTILCVSHEPVNIALTERCEGLESVYAGSVVEVMLPAGSLTDPIASGRAIGEAIAANQAAGVLVLNGGLINTAIGVVDFLGSDALIGAIGRSPFSLVQVYEGSAALRHRRRRLHPGQPRRALVEERRRQPHHPRHARHDRAARRRNHHHADSPLVAQPGVHQQLPRRLARANLRPRHATGPRPGPLLLPAVGDRQARAKPRGRANRPALCVLHLSLEGIESLDVDS